MRNLKLRVSAMALAALAITGCGDDADVTPNPTGGGAPPATEGPTVSFGDAASSMSEADGSVSIALVLHTEEPLEEGITVEVGAGSGTADPEDYVLGDMSVTFPAGAENGTQASIAVEAVDDALVEGNDTIDFDIVGIDGAAIAAPAGHQLTIEDDDVATASISADKTTTNEDGTITATVTLSLGEGGALERAVSVDLAREGDVDGDDVSDLSATQVTFAAGSADGASQSVTLNVWADVDSEPDESIVVRITDVSAPLAIGTDAATVTVQDDDAVIVSDAAYLLENRIDPSTRRPHVRGGMWGGHSPFAAAYDDATGTLYVADVWVWPMNLIAVDMATGAKTRVGPLGSSNDGFIAEGMAYDPDNDRIFALDSSARAILSVSTETGAATVLHQLSPSIGTHGLAYDPDTDTLYTTSASRLYAIDPGSGTMTDIGAYGVATTMQRLVFDNATGTLYGVNGSGTQELITIDTATGAGTLEGDISGADFLAGGLAWDSTSGSLISVDQYTQSIYEIAPSTRQATLSGMVGAYDVSGMAYDSTADVVYGISQVSNTVMTIDPVTGDGRVLSKLSDPNAQIEALVHQTGNTLIGYDFETSNLVSIDAQTGVVTTIGDPGKVLRGLAKDAAGTIYAIDSVQLFTVNASNGVLTPLGDTDIGAVEGLGHDDTSGTLYAVGGSGELFSLDKSTGAGTSLGGTSDIFPRSLTATANGIYSIGEYRRTLLRYDATDGRVTTIGGMGIAAMALAHDTNTGTTYAADISGTVWSFDHVAGSATALGDPGFGALGLAFNPNDNILYAGSGSTLYEMDPVNDTVSNLGDAGVALHGLAYDAATDTLYASDGVTLHIVDPSVPSATSVGDFGAAYASVLGLGWDPARGVLYGSDVNAFAVLRIDTTDGAATKVSDVASLAPYGLTVAK